MKMKKILPIILGFVVVSFMGCSKTTKTLVDQTQHIEEGYYWGSSFVGDAGAELDVSMNVTSGGPVDILLMNETGYTQFEQMFETETLVDDHRTLSPTEREYDYYFAVNSGDAITGIFSSDETAEIGLYADEDDDETVYEERTTSDIFTYTFTKAATASFYVYTPSESISVTYDISITKPKAKEFTYYSDGSALNVKSKSYTFEAPETGTYYVVINNAGGIKNGATPEGAVDVKIKIIGHGREGI